MSWTGLQLVWCRRGGLILAATYLLFLVTAQVAAADVIGQAPPALSWIELKDSRGISAWSYEMSLDRGGITDPGKFFWAAIVDLSWSLYWGGVVLAIWFLDWVLAFDWVGLLATPIIAVGNALQGVIDRFGLVPTLLTLAAVAAVIWMARGKWATGVWELAMTLVIAALASGVLAQPLGLVAGSEDGLIYTARDWGFELAGELSKNTAAGTSPDAAAMRQQLTGQMVDTFVRQPAEMINFGQVLDGGRCESTYDDVLKSGPHGLEPAIRDKVGGCDGALGDYAANPASGMATGAVLFAPAALVILTLAVAIAGTVLLAGVNVLWQGLKTIVHLVLGLLPGGFRGSLLLTVTEALMSLILLGFSTIFLAVFMMVVQALFADATDATGSAVARAFVITDVVLLIGLLVFLKTRKRIQAAAHRLAEFMAQRPGTGAKPARLPERINSGLGSTAAKLAGVGLSLAYLKRRTQPQPAGGPSAMTPPPGPAVRTVFSGTGQRPPTAPPAPPAGPADPSTPAPGGSPARAALPGATPRGPTSRAGGGLARVAARKLAGTAIGLGAKAGLAYVTGGASEVLTAAATAARARRTAKAMTSVSRRALASRLGQPGTTATGPSTIRLPAAARSRPGPVAASAPPRPDQPAAPAGPRPVWLRRMASATAARRPAQPSPRPGGSAADVTGLLRRRPRRIFIDPPAEPARRDVPQGQPRPRPVRPVRRPDPRHPRTRKKS